jgi:hypothetical protein
LTNGKILLLCCLARDKNQEYAMNFNHPSLAHPFEIHGGNGYRPSQFSKNQDEEKPVKSPHDNYWSVPATVQKINGRWVAIRDDGKSRIYEGFGPPPPDKR